MEQIVPSDGLNPTPINQPSPSPASPPNRPPDKQLKTNRSLLRYILLSIVTFGIYHIVFFSRIVDDINTVASKHDGKKTMHYFFIFMFYLLPFLISLITLRTSLLPLDWWGITIIIYFVVVITVTLVWFHRISNRIGTELKRRGIDYAFGARSFWLWHVLGALIIAGPYVYIHKIARAMNLLARDYNVRG